MDSRPKLKPEPAILDRLFDIFGIILLLALWGIVLLAYNKLPETIAIHFDAAGKANGYGSKSGILLLPILSTAVFIGLSILNRYPHVFNYPVAITEDNAAKQYQLATRLIRMINVALLLSFVVISYTISSGQPKDSIGGWMLPMILAITTIPVVVYFIQAKRAA